MMKIGCIALSVLVAILAGLLSFSVQYNGFFLQPELTDEELAAADVDPVIVVSEVLVSPQLGLAEELLSALREAQEELSEVKLDLDKRDENVKALNASYVTLQKETRALIGELEISLNSAGEGESKNFKKLAVVYSKMSPESVAQSLKLMDSERVARILTSMETRSMASVMDATIEGSPDGGELVAQWSEAIRLMGDEEK